MKTLFWLKNAPYPELWMFHYLGSKGYHAGEMVIKKGCVQWSITQCELNSTSGWIPTLGYGDWTSAQLMVDLML